MVSVAGAAHKASGLSSLSWHEVLLYESYFCVVLIDADKGNNCLSLQVIRGCEEGFAVVEVGADLEGAGGEV